MSPLRLIIWGVAILGSLLLIIAIRHIPEAALAGFGALAVFGLAALWFRIAVTALNRRLMRP